MRHLQDRLSAPIATHAQALPQRPRGTKYDANLLAMSSPPLVGALCNPLRPAAMRVLFERRYERARSVHSMFANNADSESCMGNG